LSHHLLQRRILHRIHLWRRWLLHVPRWIIPAGKVGDVCPPGRFAYLLLVLDSPGGDEGYDRAPCLSDFSQRIDLVIHSHSLERLDADLRSASSISFRGWGLRAQQLSFPACQKDPLASCRRLWEVGDGRWSNSISAINISFTFLRSSPCQENTLALVRPTFFLFAKKWRPIHPE